MLENWKSFRKINPELLSPFLLVGDGRTYDEICAEFNSIEAVSDALTELRSNLPKVISYSLMASVMYQLHSMHNNRENVQSPIEIRIYQRDRKIHVLICTY